MNWALLCFIAIAIISVTSLAMTVIVALRGEERKADDFGFTRGVRDQAEILRRLVKSVRFSSLQDHDKYEQLAARVETLEKENSEEGNAPL